MAIMFWKISPTVDEKWHNTNVSSGAISLLSSVLAIAMGRNEDLTSMIINTYGLNKANKALHATIYFQMLYSTEMKICFLEPDYKSDNTLQYLFHYKPYISNGTTEQIFYKPNFTIK